MFHASFMPLDRHYESGFGATADAFLEAAERLDLGSNNKKFFHSHLPINFLYRHAIELYLKSLIILIHRRFQLTSGKDSHEPNPRILIENTWKEIHHVHGIKDLYEFFKTLVITNADQLNAVCQTDWSDIPAELENWINIIDDADARSTFLRYPVTNNAADHDKSSFKKTSADQMIAQARSDGKKVMAMLIVDDNDNIVESFKLDESPLEELHNSLVEAAKLFSVAHFGMRCELSDGF